MTKPTDKDATIKRLQDKNQLLQKRIDTLLEDNDRLMLELQARVQSSVDDARRKSWGGNGRY
jgi:chaperonin cofactor prefoldin